MTAKMHVGPNPAATGSQLQVRAVGLAKRLGHLLEVTPPVGPAQERLPVSDAEGALSESFFAYAPGKWNFVLRVQREDDPLAEVELEVQG